MKMNRTDAARVKKLNAQVIELRNQIEAIEAPYRQRAAEAMVGLCFKTRNNYSCPEKPSDYWWLYVKVMRVGEHGTLHCLHFEVDKDGNAFVRRDGYHRPDSLGGYQTVSPDEFDREFSKMLKHLERCRAAATTKQEEGGAGASLVGLSQSNSVVAGQGNVDQRISMPAARTSEEAAGLVHLGIDGAEHDREAASPTGPHAAHRNPGDGSQR